MKRIREFFRRARKADSSIEPIAPRVTPAPEDAERLERRRAELDYTPSHGFLLDHPARERVA